MRLYNEYLITRAVALNVCFMCHLSQEWTKLEKPKGAPWPVERDSHAACCFNHGEKLLITGGVDVSGSPLSDAWILDVDSRKWGEVSGSIT